MSVIILPRRFGGQSQQPQQGPAINWGNQIASGLCFAALPLGTSMIDAMTNNPGALGGSTPPTFAGTAQGRSLKFTAGTVGTSSVSFGSKVATADIALAPCSFFFLANRPASANGGLAEHDDGSTIGWGVGIDSTARLYFKRYFSGTDYQARGPTFSATGPLTFGATYDGAGGATGGKIYYEGLSVTVTDTAPTGTSTTDAASTLYLGRETLNGAFGGYISLGLIFRRQLSDAEMLALNKDPYQVFKAPQRNLYVVPAAAAASNRPQVFACQ